MAEVKPIPDSYPRVIPYLHVDGASAAIEFYGTVLGTTEEVRMPRPDGGIGHAELRLGDAMIMLADETPAIGALGPKSVGGTPVTISVYVQDVDAAFERAVQQGATPLRPVEDQFYGDRSGSFEDPFGHRWSISSHVEDVAPEEMARRARQVMGGLSSS